MPVSTTNSKDLVFSQRKALALQSHVNLHNREVVLFQMRKSSCSGTQNPQLSFLTIGLWPAINTSSVPRSNPFRKDRRGHGSSPYCPSSSPILYCTHVSTLGFCHLRSLRGHRAYSDQWNVSRSGLCCLFVEALRIMDTDNVQTQACSFRQASWIRMRWSRVTN